MLAQRHRFDPIRLLEDVKGLDLALIANITDMAEEKIIQILKEHGRLD